MLDTPEDSQSEASLASEAETARKLRQRALAQAPQALIPDIDVHHFLVSHDPALAARLVFITGGAFGPVAAEYLNDAGNLKLEKPFTNSAFSDVVSDRIRASISEPPTRLDIPIPRQRDRS